MKSVLLIRHAKSSWDTNSADFDRPLNQRGQADAPVMAERMIKKQVSIDFFVSSPAKRALATAAFFAKAYGKKTENIFTVPSLYQPTLQAFYRAIEGFDDNFNAAAIFSHNSAITDFANQLTSFKIDDMPTCAVFAVKAAIKNWKEFTSAPKEFWFFDYPKSH